MEIITEIKWKLLLTMLFKQQIVFLGSIGRDDKIQTQFPYMLLLIIYS